MQRIFQFLACEKKRDCFFLYENIHTQKPIDPYTGYWCLRFRTFSVRFLIMKTTSVWNISTFLYPSICRQQYILGLSFHCEAGHTKGSNNLISLLVTPREATVLYYYLSNQGRQQFYIITGHTKGGNSLILLLVTPREATVLYYYWSHQERQQSYIITGHTKRGNSIILLLVTPREATVLYYYWSHQGRQQSYYITSR